METSIISRIRQLIEHYGLNAAIFADRIDIQRSALSHIFSERNKPSLDVIQKIVATFPEINPNWLLTGRENMITTNDLSKNIDKEDNISINVGSEVPEFTDVTNTEIQSDPEIEPKKEDIFEDRTQAKKKIEMITVFYTDKTFSVYHPGDLPPSLGF